VYRFARDVQAPSVEDLAELRERLRKMRDDELVKCYNDCLQARDMDKDELLKLTREEDMETLARRGLVERTEAILITVQTAESATILQQPYEASSGCEAHQLWQPARDDVPAVAVRGGRRCSAT
jgi:hypothetical protein